MGMALHHFCALCEPVKARHSKVFDNEIDFFDTLRNLFLRGALHARRDDRFRAFFRASIDSISI
jgi:hypothetical protein